MATFLLLSFLAFVVTLPQVFCIPSYGGFVPVLQGFPGGGYDKKLPVLTCAINFTDYYKKEAGLVNAISVTIREKSGSYGGGKSQLFSNIGYGALTGSGLTATIDIYSAIGGPVSVAFTERARPEKGCFPEDFGPFLTPKLDLGGSYGGYAGYAGYGTGNYGNYGNYGSYGNYGNGYGLGGVIGGLGSYGGYYGGGFGGGYGFAGDGYGDGGKAPGVIAKTNVAPGTASSINIDYLDGFSYLKELAGRGVVVCPTKAVSRGYHGSVCEGGILACCALHYDQGDHYVNGGKYDSY